MGTVTAVIAEKSQLPQELELTLSTSPSETTFPSIHCPPSFKKEKISILNDHLEFILIKVITAVCYLYV